MEWVWVLVGVFILIMTYREYINGETCLTLIHDIFFWLDFEFDRIKYPRIYLAIIITQVIMGIALIIKGLIDFF